MKGWDFAAKPLKNFNQVDPQIFLLSQNRSLLASFLGNSEKWILVCRHAKNAVHRCKGMRNKLICGYFGKICQICMETWDFEI